MSSVKVTFLMPESVHARVKKVAIARGAKLYHKTGEPILTDTLVYLLERGLRASDSEEDTLSDLGEEKDGESKKGILQEVLDRLSQVESEVKTTANFRGEIEEAIAAQLAQLEQGLDDVKQDNIIFRKRTKEAIAALAARLDALESGKRIPVSDAFPSRPSATDEDETSSNPSEAPEGKQSLGELMTA